MPQETSLLSFEDEGFGEAQKEIRRFGQIFFFTAFVFCLALVFFFQDITCLAFLLAISLAFFSVFVEQTFFFANRNPQKQFIEVFSTGISRKLVSSSSIILKNTFISFYSVYSIEHDNGCLAVDVSGEQIIYIYSKKNNSAVKTIYDTFLEVNNISDLREEQF